MVWNLILGVFFVVIVFVPPSYPKDKENLNPANETLTIAQSAPSIHRDIDFSSEYSFAESQLPKNAHPPALIEKIEQPAVLPDAPPVSQSDTILSTLVESKELVPQSVTPQKTDVETLYKNYGFNKAVEKSINYYSKRIKENFSKVLSRSGRYLSVISEIFKEKNLPDELVFLPIIESGFNMHAYSPKRAAGMWQFIAGTGKRYGLKIDWWVDERHDPIKATVAAADYLSDLYAMFGSWNLALAAYNAGEGKIYRAINKTKTDDFWEIRNTKHIRKETKDYVPFYIAATAIAKDPEGFGFDNITYYEPLAYDEVVIDAPMDIEAIARYAEVDAKEIRDLNPELKRWCTPPNVLSYTVRIPVGTKENFLANLTNNTERNDFSAEYYTVKKGDTLKKIASRTGVSTDAIIALNSLSKNPQFKTGETILVPPKEVAHLTKDLEDGKSKKAVKYKKSRRASKKKRGSYLATSTDKKGKTS